MWCSYAGNVLCWSPRRHLKWEVRSPLNLDWKKARATGYVGFLPTLQNRWIGQFPNYFKTHFSSITRLISYLCCYYLHSFLLVEFDPKFSQFLARFVKFWMLKRRVHLMFCKPFLTFERKPKPRLNLDIVLILSILALKIAYDNCLPSIVGKSSISSCYLSHLLVPEQFLSL